MYILLQNLSTLLIYTVTDKQMFKIPVDTTSRTYTDHTYRPLDSTAQLTHLLLLLFLTAAALNLPQSAASVCLFAICRWHLVANRT